MPNWCSNEVDIIGSADNVKEFQAFLRKAQLATEDQRELAEDGTERKFFDLLVPMPKKLKGKDAQAKLNQEFADAMMGNQERKYSDWYTWSLAHWGTKWDVDLQHVSLDNNTISISYDTAWSPANHVWEKVTKDFPSLTIKVRFLEEGNCFIGETEYTNGECVKDICLDINTELYIAAGCVADANGEIDWDEDQEYNLYDLFEEGLEKWQVTTI
jgi:hypothetical protein